MFVFVYGSLKRGKKLSHYMKRAIFIGNGKTLHKYPLVISKKGWYPYLIDKKGVGNFVDGEVYKIDFRLLRVLDRVEEAPNYYRRKEIFVKVNNKKIKCWVYFVNKKVNFLKKDLLINF